MKFGVGFSEVLLILALIVVLTDSKEVPGMIRKGYKTMRQLRGAIKKFFTNIENEAGDRSGK